LPSIFFERNYSPIDLASRGVLSPEKANYAYKRYLELMGKEEPKKSGLMGIEIPDSLVLIYIADSLLVDIEYLTAAVAYTRTGAYGILNPFLNLLSYGFGVRVGILAGLLLTTLFVGVMLFAASMYLKEEHQKIPFLIAIAELIFIVSHALHL
jgi:hypothetical protein